MPGFWTRLDDTLAGMVPGSGGVVGVQQRRADRLSAQEQARQMQALIDQLAGNDPAKRFQIMMDAKGYAGALNDRMKPVVGSEGQTIFGQGPNAPPTATLPKTGFQGDVPYSQSGANIQYGTPRPMTYAETEANRHNIQTETLGNQRMQFDIDALAKQYGLDAQKLAETIRANQAREQIGWFNARKPPSSAVNINLGGGGAPAPPLGYRLE